ncbi:MAG TPA: KGG domain-containing protein [Candidatus Saccharimonas sp.]|nr:KGG domain-containing protein [Candidatus Saccharimonas sp.]
MPGTVEGGKLAAKQNQLRHGKDFYARIGAMGGRKGHTGGFAANRDLARAAGRKGGLISRRGKAVVKAQVVATTVVETEATKNDFDLAA